MLVPVLVGVITHFVTNKADQITAESQPPVIATVPIQTGPGEDPCGQFGVPGQSALNSVPPLVLTMVGNSYDSLTQQTTDWMKQAGAKFLGYGEVVLTLQGSGQDSVVLQSMRVVVDSRSPASITTALAEQCGGGVTPRTFSVDLDSPAPVVVPDPGMDSAGQTIAPAGFPFKVAANDPEIFRIHTKSLKDDVAFHFEIPWISQGREGILKFYDHEKPFVGYGLSKVSQLSFNNDDGSWSRPQPGKYSNDGSWQGS